MRKDSNANFLSISVETLFFKFFIFYFILNTIFFLMDLNLKWLYLSYSYLNYIMLFVISHIIIILIIFNILCPLQLAWCLAFFLIQIFLVPFRRLSGHIFNVNFQTLYHFILNVLIYLYFQRKNQRTMVY